MKYYTYLKETIKNNLSYQFLFLFLRLWNLDEMIFKCSLIHYGMTMLMILVFLVEIFSLIENLLGLSVF